MFGRKFVFNVDILIEQDGDGYHAFCPALKGLHVDGDTVEEVKQNAKDAVEAYLLSLKKHGDPIPLAELLKIHAVEKEELAASFPRKDFSHYLLATSI